MKSKKVLIGLIVAAFVGGAHFASAQTKANFQNNLIEIGPDNIGGRVRTILVDEQDPNHTTLYAGGVAGGLYKKVGDQNWEYIPFFKNGVEITLPITHMIQMPDYSILIATGEGFVDMHGYNEDRMSPKGRGVYRFYPKFNSFEMMAGTDPKSYPDWTYVNRLASLERDGHLYIYAATSEGLFRWDLDTDDPNWHAAPSKVKSGNFQDVIIISSDNVAYASTPGKLYRIGNVTAQSAAVDVTSSNSAFANSSRIELAAATAHAFDSTTGSYEHTTYLYALVADTNGLLEGVYLTHDQQRWSRLTTSTVVPFNSENPGYLNAAIAIEPTDYKTIYIGGSYLYSGRGYVENSYYQWTMLSYNENTLNNGNYMGDVFMNSYFVHSGIHQIVRTFRVDDGDTNWVIYLATDGGIYTNADKNSLIKYKSLNKGFNTVQFNHIAVCPDGSIIGGAVDNGCPFIQSRNAHEGTAATNAWYDNDSNSFMNHLCNILWTGNGGGVAASMFQQLVPHTRRGIFVSSEPDKFIFETAMGTVGNAASFGRACADYADYTNTQTWTTAERFLSDIVPSSNQIPQVKLWETTNNNIWNDSITFTLDTLGTYFHNNQEMPLTSNTVIESGDRVLVASLPTFSYPFYYTFNKSFTVKDQLQHKVHNPVVSRAIVNGRNAKGYGIVCMNMTPNYYRNVWDPNEANSTDDATQEKLMNWAQIYISDYNYSVGNIAFSQDGKSIYINVILDSTGESYIFRLYDFVGANVNNIQEMKMQLGFTKDYAGSRRITHFDTIFDANGNLFKRPITSITVDPRDAEDNLILTFGGYQTLEPNMVYIRNASDPDTRTIIPMSISESTSGMATADPVYSALVEYTTGAIYAGTEKGVFVSPSANNPSWQPYGAFNGVPVTSIVQQTKSLQRQRYDAHDGVNTETYIFAKTKYPYAIYFGTYGRGIFMDTTYVVDHIAEVCDSDDWTGINTVDKGDNRVVIYPNPAVDHATVELSIVNAGNAVVRIYDINGKMVRTEKLGYLNEGVHQYSIDCTKFNKGMYLMNVNIGKESATSKLIVR